MEQTEAKPKKVYTEADLEKCPVFQAFKQMMRECGLPSALAAIEEKKAEFLKRYNEGDGPGEFTPLFYRHDVLGSTMWGRLKQEPYCLHVKIGVWQAWLNRGYWSNRPGLWWLGEAQPHWVEDDWGSLGEPPGYTTPVELIAEFYNLKEEWANSVTTQSSDWKRYMESVFWSTIRIQDIEEPLHHQVCVFDYGWPQDHPWAVTEWYEHKEIRGGDAATLLDALKLAWKWIEHPDRKAIRKIERKRKR